VGIAKKRILCLGVLLALFLISLLSLFYPEPLLRKNVIFFPKAGSNSEELSGEVRALPNRNELLQSLSDLVQVAVEGPLSYEYMPLFMPGAKLRNIYFDAGIAYVDLSEGVLLNYQFNSRNLLENLKVIEQSICFNYKSVKEVRFFLEGQEIGAWPYIK